MYLRSYNSLYNSNIPSHAALLQVYGLTESLYCVLEDVAKNKNVCQCLAQSATAVVVVMLLSIVSLGSSSERLTRGLFAKCIIANGRVIFSVSLQVETSSKKYSTLGLSMTYLPWRISSTT